jgi:lysine-N-methylase
MARYVALRCVTRFRCIGAECDDHCCGDWAVPVDKHHHDLLKRALGADLADRQRFARSLELAPAPKRTSDSFAFLRPDDHGNCSFLEGGLCSLQARFGEELLPDACAIYPRVLNAAGDLHELSAELSCPEAARLCLLAVDGTEIVEVPPELAGRARVRQRSGDDDPPFIRYNDAIRGALYRLLSCTGYSLSERLFFASCFADQTSEFFSASTGKLDGARLTHELRLIDQPKVLDELRVCFAELEGAPGLVTEVIAGLLATWLSVSCPSRFRRLIRDVLETLAMAYQGPDGPSTDDASETTSIDTEWMCRAYEACRAAHLASIAPRLEHILDNYCRHFIVRHWYIDAPTLLTWIQRLLLRVAILRLLILGHPMVSKAVAAEPAERDRLVDAAAVEVIYALTRALEHNATCILSVTRALDTKLPSLSHSVALLKL